MSQSERERLEGKVNSLLLVDKPYDAETLITNARWKHRKIEEDEFFVLAHLIDRHFLSKQFALLGVTVKEAEFGSGRYPYKLVLEKDDKIVEIHAHDGVFGGPFLAVEDPSEV